MNYPGYPYPSRLKRLSEAWGKYAHDQGLGVRLLGEVRLNAPWAYPESRSHFAWNGDGEEQAPAKPGLVFVLELTHH